jgi:DNA-binding transcriptional ArsR family regulator
MTAEGLDAWSRLGTALGDDSRRRILLALLVGARYPSELAVELEMTRANVSNHLTCLRGCGLVRATPEGRRVRYELADARLAAALETLAGLVLEVAPCCFDEAS